MKTEHCKVKGSFVSFMNDTFYKIENYDEMDNFFMSITSSSDIWNFCWSQGGITAGRVDSNNAVFPYYTADKVFDARSYTGSFTALRVCGENKDNYWQPFYDQGKDLYNINRNIYKNSTGTKVYFEEVNNDLKLTFLYGWTSSDRYGLVRHVSIKNTSNKNITVRILDGCQNIMSSCTTSDFQNENSILLDAYKKTDIDSSSNLAIFAVSSIVSDKAEPCEGLYANISWFSTNDEVYTDPEAPLYFKRNEKIPFIKVLKGKRPSCFIHRNLEIKPDAQEQWFQVFNTRQDSSDIALLQHELDDREEITKKLEENISQGISKMKQYINFADGIQETGNQTACIHHSANVMFNIMRGGIFLNENLILKKDFILFVSQKNQQLLGAAEKITNSYSEEISYEELKKAIEKSNDVQLLRIFYDYMPLSFSRKHGDPSRPWNRFKIHIQDEKKNPILNYEGNWRDIFQNWEPLAYSFPYFLPNMISLFLDSMTADGYNPGSLSRTSYHWEVPQENNPWANIGYWGDHQVIYLCKLLETACSFNDPIISALNEKRFSSTRVPYKLKSHDEIMSNPRESILFDRNLNTQIDDLEKIIGMDAQLYLDNENKPVLVSMTTKLLQVCLTKLSSLIPGGGIWLNTQRPEWNDANNALAGYGLSIVTLCYLYRYLNTIKNIFTRNNYNDFTVTPEVKNLFSALAAIYKKYDSHAAAQSDTLRKEFADAAGRAFENQRNVLYNKGISDENIAISKQELLEGIEIFLQHCECSIRMNKRTDGLFHSYNTMKTSSNTIQIEYLPVMLEGQVAILSSGLLTSQETIEVCSVLRNSELYIDNQHSYILYPNKELPLFLDKNSFTINEAHGIPLLKKMLEEDDRRIIRKDINDLCHFNADFTNSRTLQNKLTEVYARDSYCPSDDETHKIISLYEKVFNHQSFTGRSGTFYAYEGLGSIYWHMVAKLMLAVQENMWKAYDLFTETKNELHFKDACSLANYYYDVRKGIGYNKKPEEYGAFPFDPYSHTPYEQGAKQPGMTGQVKEEILTRMGELGLRVKEECAEFNPVILETAELTKNSDLVFTWGSIPIRYVYEKENQSGIIVTHSINGSEEKAVIDGLVLPPEWSKRLFSRDKKISMITVNINSYGKLLNK